MIQERVVATYLVETPHPLEHAAAVIAGEQSSGTFVSVPGETLELKERFGAQVLHIKAFDSVGSPSLPGSKAPPSQNRTWSVTPSGSQLESSTMVWDRDCDGCARMASSPTGFC